MEKTVRKAQRRQHSSWSFYQLRQFIQYKADLAGIPVMLVDPKNTSRTCIQCGYVAKENRSLRDNFCCRACGYVDLADKLAAENIRRDAVN
ncbi:transposase (fragment) [Candidatus Babela massiliensis]|uniref:Transposase n=2 Tax=Candidatus Babela massiliensis TaxID=673862 RepID=V6DHW8_9BACT